MKRPSDLLLLAIVLAAALVGTLAPGGGAAFHFSPSVMPAFSESFLVSAGPNVRGPSGEIFRTLGKLGRVVGAVPGPVTSATSVGPHHLLREGTAKLVTCVSDLVDHPERRPVGGPPIGSAVPSVASPLSDPPRAM